MLAQSFTSFSVQGHRLEGALCVTHIWFPVHNQCNPTSKHMAKAEKKEVVPLFKTEKNHDGFRDKELRDSETKTVKRATSIVAYAETRRRKYHKGNGCGRQRCFRLKKCDASSCLSKSKQQDLRNVERIESRKLQR